MPRKRKQAKPPPGLPYGDGRRLEEHNNLVAQSGGPPPAAQGGAPAPAPLAGGAPPAAPSGRDQLLRAAANGPSPGPPLGRPSERPNEPVTSGLRIGAGPGPEALGPAAPGPVEFYEQLAAASGDPLYMHLANQARRRG